jgi:hypothetical protein
MKCGMRGSRIEEADLRFSSEKTQTYTWRCRWRIEEDRGGSRRRFS